MNLIKCFGVALSLAAVSSFACAAASKRPLIAVINSGGGIFTQLPEWIQSVKVSVLNGNSVYKVIFVSGVFEEKPSYCRASSIGARSNGREFRINGRIRADFVNVVDSGSTQQSSSGFLLVCAKQSEASAAG
ncbi:hypothetical protein [Pseudomonas sp. Xaverov 259]|uniref:hypothetical protein n=1 Tax=Pseudomonas sp. Xaverov 259 TaxID=2666086 RepID=UPI001C5B0142|nr:hypothetical protein [Pseudomonas sp. Xaverov 259]